LDNLSLWNLSHCIWQTCPNSERLRYCVQMAKHIDGSLTMPGRPVILYSF